MFLFADSCTQCQCPGEKYLKPTQQVTAQVWCCFVLSPFVALVTLVLFSKECSCLMPVAFVLDVSL